jgi:hypothetical protein
MPNVAEISAMSRPSLTSRAKVSHRVTSSGSSRVFSRSDASMASASSPASRMATGSGPWSMPSTSAMAFAVQRRRPATISWTPLSLPACGRTISGTMTPRLRIEGRMSPTSGGLGPCRMFTLDGTSLLWSIKSSFIGLLLLERRSRLSCWMGGTGTQCGETRRASSGPSIIKRRRKLVAVPAIGDAAKFGFGQNNCTHAPRGIGP